MCEESGGEENANDADSARFRFVQDRCRGRGGRETEWGLTAELLLSKPEPIKGIGSVVGRCVDASDLV